jgi:hypothetical protein
VNTCAASTGPVLGDTHFSSIQTGRPSTGARAGGRATSHSTTRSARSWHESNGSPTEVGNSVTGPMQHGGSAADAGCSSAGLTGPPHHRPWLADSNVVRSPVTTASRGSPRTVASVMWSSRADNSHPQQHIGRPSHAGRTASSRFASSLAEQRCTLAIALRRQHHRVPMVLRTADASLSGLRSPSADRDVSAATATSPTGGTYPSKNSLMTQWTEKRAET